MVSSRYLGAGFTVVHGPAGATARVHWLLDQGFAGCEVAPSARTVDWGAIRDAMGKTPARFCSVRVESPLDPRRDPVAGLATGHRGELQAVRARIDAACAQATAIGVPLVILEAGSVVPAGERGCWDLGDPSAGWNPDVASAQVARRAGGLTAAVDRLCRNLWQVLRDHPQLRFALTPNRDVAGVLDPRTLEWVLEDLGSSGRLGLWHDSAVAGLRARWVGERLGEGQGAWLDGFGDAIVGATVADPWEGGPYGPPGTGIVDFPLMASYLNRSGQPLPLVVQLDPSVPKGELPGVMAFLDKTGL